MKKNKKYKFYIFSILFYTSFLLIEIEWLLLSNWKFNNFDCANIKIENDRKNHCQKNIF